MSLESLIHPRSLPAWNQLRLLEDTTDIIWLKDFVHQLVESDVDARTPSGQESEEGWTPASEDDLIPGCQVVDTFWIRAEYIRIFDACLGKFETWKMFRSAQPPSYGDIQKPLFFFITGQAGIGKTWWAKYAAARCYAEGRPFLWFRPGRSPPQLFTADGVFELPDKWFYTVKADAMLWTFFDNESKQNLSDIACEGSPLVIFFTTSPAQKRYDWARLEKDTTPRHVVMNPWTKREISYIARPYGKTIAEANARYDSYGPTIRVCLTMDDVTYDAYKAYVELALADISVDKLKKLVHDATRPNSDSDALSHRLCLVTRRSRDIFHEGLGDRWDISPISSYIRSQLIITLRNAELVEKVNLYRQFEALPASRRMAGVLWEAIVHGEFLTAIKLTYRQMVKLPSPGKTNPRWHSSHLPLDNPDLETLRRNAQEFSVLISQPKVEQYSHDSPPTGLIANVLYVPESTSETAIDSFILSDGILYLFQLTIAKIHTVNQGLIDLSKKYKFPSVDKWRFIFIIPEHHTLHVPQQSALPKMELYSSQFILS